MTPVTFSNPRLVAEFTDWPSGGKRVPCRFAVEEHPSRGWRISRTTTGKPKYTRYTGPACIVDGDDGRTYLLSIAPPIYGGFVSVHASDFMDARWRDGNSSVFERDEPTLHSLLVTLIRAAA